MTPRPLELRIGATALRLHYRDIGAALAWHESVLPTRLPVDQGRAKGVPVSAGGYLGSVDEAEITNEGGRVRTFVGYDPEGHSLEWDTFLEVVGNEWLPGHLRGS